MKYTSKKFDQFGVVFIDELKSQPERLQLNIFLLVNYR
jgi:hypothetical protein